MRSLELLVPFGIMGGARAVNLFATSYSGTVDTLALETDTSGNYSLSHAHSITACGQQPSWLTLDTTTNVLYCSNEAYDPTGSLTAFSICDDGSLVPQAVATTIGSDVFSQLYGGPNGDGFIAIAEYGTSSVSTFALPITNGSKALQSWTFTMSKPGPVPSRQDSPHPHQVILDPTKRFILNPDLGADVVRVFSVDDASGMLTLCSNLTAAPGSGPRHVSFYVPTGDPTQGAIMYLASEIANTVTAYSLSYPSTGELKFQKVQGPVFPYPNGQAPNNSYVAEVRVLNQTLTASNRGDQSFGPGMDSLALFSLSHNGTFTFEKLYPSGGNYPRTFAVNAAGDLLAAGNQMSHSVAVLKRDPRTGAIGELVGNVTLGGQVSSVIWAE